MSGVEERRYLMLGVCGMGMAPLSVFLAGRGDQVIGVDDYPVKEVLDLLEKSAVQTRDHPLGLEKITDVVLSSALRRDVERVEQIKKEYPDANFWYRGELLAQISNQYKSIVVAGSHGKTSTAANLIYLAENVGLNCSYILGGLFKEDLRPPAKFVATDGYLILEVDESDRTIDGFSPYQTIITNLDLDHVDSYQNENELLETFASLVKRTEKSLFLGESNDVLEGAGENIDVQLVEGDGLVFDEQNWQLAKSAAHSLMVENEVHSGGWVPPKESLVKRRQDFWAINDDFQILADYAHHPTEVSALIKHTRNRFKEAEIRLVFQPHRYSRTKALKDDFVKALKDEKVFLIKEYGAFEKEDAEGSSESLRKALQEQKADVELVGSVSQLIRLIEKDFLAGEPVVWQFVGAGDIQFWTDYIVSHFQQRKEGFEPHWYQYLEARIGAKSFFSKEEPLKKKVTLNVGGSAEYYFEPANLADLQLALKTADQCGVNVRVIGKGSNLLIEEDTVEGLTIHLGKNPWNKIEQFSDLRTHVGAGVSLKALARHATKHGLGGLEFGDGIPGSVGGAARMNAGAMGQEFCDRIVELVALDLTGKVHRFSNEELNYSYRNCSSVEDLIVISVVVEATGKTDPNLIAQAIEANRSKRLASQPAEPSAGCMFKNPDGDYAGRLIETAGLKGVRVGNARVSEKHANFLVTEKHAKAEDVVSLLQHVKDRVKSVHGVTLEQEIKRF